MGSKRKRPPSYVFHVRDLMLVCDFFYYDLPASPERVYGAENRLFNLICRSHDKRKGLQGLVDASCQPGESEPEQSDAPVEETAPVTERTPWPSADEVDDVEESTG